ncbi:MAG TPA: hypothetical protein VGA09_03670 [Candidatus Binatia bacterium]
MKPFFCSSVMLLIFFLAGNSYAHFTGKGHVHTLAETRQIFLNPDCRSTDTCDLKRFMLTTAVYEAWFSDDPNYPTYGNGAIIEYATDSVDALEKYAIVQFKKGCVFYSSKNSEGKIDRNVRDTAPSFGENIPFCFPHWVIDSQDTDPVYNSDPEYGRFYLLRWNQPGSYDNRTQKYYGAEKPKIPVAYMADYPAGAFVTETGVKNVALEFKTCIYREREVPAQTRRDNIAFAKPITCFEWQNVYVYDFDTGRFRTDLAYAPKWEEPTTLDAYLLVVFVTLFIALALVTFSHWGKLLSPKIAADDHINESLSTFPAFSERRTSRLSVSRF